LHFVAGIEQERGSGRSGASPRGGRQAEGRWKTLGFQGVRYPAEDTIFGV